MKDQGLKEQITKAVGNWEIPWVYPVQEGNILTRAYKRMICRMTRCAVRPVAEQATETNYGIKKAMEEMADTISRQEARIRELEKKMEILTETERDR